MKKRVKLLIGVLFFLLVMSNIYIFVMGIKSSGEMAKMEKELDLLRRENIELETRLGQIDSLEYAASVAAALEFETKAVPIYFDGLKYALNR